MGSVKQDTIKGVKWSFIEKISVQGIQFIIGVIMARILTPSDYGVVAMYGVFFAISQTFIDSGFSNALIQKQNRTEEDFCTVFYFNIAISIVCYILLFATAPWIAEFFHTPIICPIVRVDAVVLVINALMAVQMTKLTIDLDFKSISLRSVLSCIGSGVIGIFLAYRGWGVWAIVVQGIVCSIINVVFIWIYCKWIPRKKFSYNSFHEMLSYGSKLLASGLINTLYSNLTTIIIGRYFKPSDLGEYNRGSSYPGLFVNNFNGALQRVVFPILSRYQDDDKQLIYYYRQYIAIVSLCAFFVCTLIAAVGKPLVIVLLTSKWEGCIIYLQLAAFALMFDHLSIINHTLLLAKGRSDLFLKLEIIKKPIFVAILLASIPFGVVGICVSKIVTSQVAVIINTYYTGKIFDYGYFKQIKDFIPLLLCSLVSCLPAYLFANTEVSPFVTLPVGCLSALCIYWFILRKNIYMNKVLSLIKSQI